jgi:hypothetical protein
VSETTRRVSDERLSEICRLAADVLPRYLREYELLAFDLRDALAREAVLAARVKGLEEALKRCSRRCTNPTAIENIVAAALSPAASDEGR